MSAKIARKSELSKQAQKDAEDIQTYVDILLQENPAFSMGLMINNLQSRMLAVMKAKRGEEKGSTEILYTGSIANQV